MKKWLFVLAVIALLALGSIYLFIPAQLTIVQITPVHCTTTGAYRHMATSDKWKGWWPNASANSNTFTFENSSYTLTKTLLNTLAIHIQQGALNTNSTMYLLPAAGDSTHIKWECTILTGNNPFTRIQHYRQAVALKESMSKLLTHFKTFAEKKENIYGVTFQEMIYKDSLLISTKTTLANYPNVTDIYSMLKALQQYRQQQGTTQTGYPIMNVQPLHPSRFQVMVAVPVNKAVPATSPFINQRIPRNRFLVSRVHGGTATVRQAFEQIQLYIQDYRRTVMALPFQQLITDRSQQPDSTQWITDIYVPLF